MKENPVLDRSALDRLERIGGAKLLSAMLGSFVEHGAMRVGAAQEAASVGDVRGVSDAAHALKSSAGNIGATRLQLCAQRVEHEAVQEGADARALARELADVFEQARVAALAAREQAG